MYKQNYSERVKDTQKRKYLKRKLDCGSCEALQIPGNSDDSRQLIS